MSILFIFPGLMAVDLSIAKALKTFPRLLYIAWHIAIFVLSFLVAWWMGSFIFHLVSSFMPVVAWSAIAISTLVSFILAVLLLMFLALMGIYLLWKINEKYWHIDFAKMIIDER